MKVTHLYHSGCLVELDNHILLFDNYQSQPKINPNKPLYVFVSHAHYDHFDSKIFNIKQPHTTYIFSSSIKHKYNAYYLETNQTYHIDDITINTLLSTDEGCAFIVEVEGKTIYHAGDLNWWHWEGEPQSDNDYQRIVYQQQINLIKQPIDIAFIVVDIRQEKDYLLGLQYYLSHVKTKYIFPIHYFGDYTITNKLQKEKLDNPYQAQIMNIYHKNQEFII